MQQTVAMSICFKVSLGFIRPSLLLSFVPEMLDPGKNDANIACQEADIGEGTARIAGFQITQESGQADEDDADGADYQCVKCGFFRIVHGKPP